jgi:hypothetical protein
MIARLRAVLDRSSVARLSTVVLSASSLAGCPPQSTSDAGLDAADGELDAPSSERDAGRDAALDAGPLPDRSSTVAVCRRVCSTCAS